MFDYLATWHLIEQQCPYTNPIPSENKSEADRISRNRLTLLSHLLTILSRLPDNYLRLYATHILHLLEDWRANRG